AKIVYSDPDTDIPGKSGQLAVIPNPFNMGISGTLSPDITGPLVWTGTDKGKSYWTSDGETKIEDGEAVNPPSVEWIVLRWESTTTQWVIEVYQGGMPSANLWLSSDEDVPSPELATG